MLLAEKQLDRAVSQSVRLDHCLPSDLTTLQHCNAISCFFALLLRQQQRQRRTGEAALDSSTAFACSSLSSSPAVATPCTRRAQIALLGMAAHRAVDRKGQLERPRAATRARTSFGASARQAARLWLLLFGALPPPVHLPPLSAWWRCASLSV